ncbi:ketopantoate reductase family protein [Cytobacillus sp. FJAT-54145]|uniref:2-dehydropantoate 2-reductase n=1 Tax=Cytobacillus spartinae TaxID=3299023 RepID=A0ABW6K6U1_9BACI
MKVTIVGAGSVGGFYGALLKRSGQDVTFIARGKHLEAMKENGLNVKSSSEQFSIDAEFSGDFEDLKDTDLIIFTVKSTDTTQTIQKIKPNISSNVKVLTLQNGVDNEEVLAHEFGVENVFAGAAYLSAKVDKPGSIVQLGKHALVIGGLHESQDEFVQQVANMFQDAGVTCFVSDEIMAKKWEKLLWNVTFNPLSAVTEATVGEILDDYELKGLAEHVLEEALTIAKRSKINVHDDIANRVFIDAGSVRGHQTSMLQDKLKGKPMEVESLCGFFVRRGRELGVDVPALSTIYSVLSFMDKKRCKE